MTTFSVFTDGGFKKTGESPIGSWSFVVHDEKTDKYIWKYGLVDHHKQTSQTAEMLAVIKSLDFIKDTLCGGDIFKAQRIKLSVTSDSQYCVNGASDWMHNWKRNNWEGKENIDLWKRIYGLTVNTFERVSYKWVRGHDGNKYNELADLGCNIALGRITLEKAMLTWEQYK